MGSKCLPESCTHCVSWSGPFWGQLVPKGTLELPTVRAIYQVIIGTPRLPDQFPYIDSLLQETQTMPSWIPFCANKKEQSRVFVAQAMKPKDQKLTKPVLQGDPEDEPPVPLLYISSMLPPSEQPVSPLPFSPPPSVSPPYPCQQPLSHNNVSHPFPTWSPCPQPLSHRLRSFQAMASQARALQMLL
jgi:hypothetical protein